MCTGRKFGTLFHYDLDAKWMPVGWGFVRVVVGEEPGCET